MTNAYFDAVYRMRAEVRIFFLLSSDRLTPLYKRENIRFYTEKCGFQIVGTEKDGNVELARFIMER